MNSIDNLSDGSYQTSTLQMPDGSISTITLYYRGALQRWMFDFASTQFPNGSILGQGLCVHPNILRNFKNLLDFGLAVVSTDGQDPAFIEDFVNGRVTLYILDAADVQTVEQIIYGINT